MTVKRYIAVAVCLLLQMTLTPGPAFAISPANVLVLYNADSPEGVEVASYYLQVHPGAQSLGLTGVPVTEEVQWNIYLDTIRPQVLNVLTDSIDCIVTTKGLPLRIRNPKPSPFVFAWKEYSSLESELTRIDSINSRDLMGRQGWQYSPPFGNPLAGNPFYFQDGPFDFETYGIRLTARLDGFSVQEITDSIDRAGRAVLRPGSHFLVDDDPNAPGAAADQMEQLAVVLEVLTPHGLPCMYDGSDAFVQDAPGPLLAYVGHGVHGGAPPDYLVNPDGGLAVEEADGGVFHTWESYNAYTFNLEGIAQMPSRQGLVAEWLSRGGTVGVGHVQEPGVDSTNVTREDRMFDRLIEGYTWVEAAWNATRQLSYVNTVVGDPLMVWDEWQPPGDPTVEIQIEDNLDWVFQNTALTLSNGGHEVALTVNVLDLNGNTCVDVTVQKKAGSGPGEVTVQDTADPLVKEIVGSLRTDGIADSGSLILEVTATGDMAGQTVVEVPFSCRRLGDCDGNGGVEPGDVSVMVMALNDTPPLGYRERDFDIDANGAIEPGDVLILMNILAGHPVP